MRLELYNDYHPIRAREIYCLLPLGHKSEQKKRRSVTYSTDREKQCISAGFKQDQEGIEDFNSSRTAVDDLRASTHNRSVQIVILSSQNIFNPFQEDTDYGPIYDPYIYYSDLSGLLNR